MSQVNKYNFVRWDDDGSPLTNCSSEYVLPLVTGDQLKIYINFDTPIDDTTTNWRVGLWAPSSIVLGNIATLSEDDVDGVNKNLYFTYTVGTLQRGLLRFVIYDSADSNAIKYWSNAFTFTTYSTQTAFIKYRNDFDILNYEYENQTDWYNQLRIHVRIEEPLKLTDIKGYETSSGHFVYSLVTHRKNYEFETQWFDTGAHDAFEAATTHKEIYFDDVRYERGLDQEYNQILPNKDFSFWLGRIRLLQYDYTAIAANS